MSVDVGGCYRLLTTLGILEWKCVYWLFVCQEKHDMVCEALPFNSAVAVGLHVLYSLDSLSQINN